MKSYVIIKRLMVTGLNEKNLERAHKGEFIVNAIHTLILCVQMDW